MNFKNIIQKLETIIVFRSQILLEQHTFHKRSSHKMHQQEIQRVCMHLISEMHHIMEEEKNCEIFLMMLLKKKERCTRYEHKNYKKTSDMKDL